MQRLLPLRSSRPGSQHRRASSPMTATSPSEWIADLRRRHRPETVLTLLQLQVLGPGLYRSTDLARCLGIEPRTVFSIMERLKNVGLVEFESWGKRGRLIWWVATSRCQRPDREALFPRWILRSNAARRFEVLLGTEKETAAKLGMSWRSLSNFLNESRSSYRLLSQWSIELNPIQFVAHNESHLS